MKTLKCSGRTLFWGVVLSLPAFSGTQSYFQVLYILGEKQAAFILLKFEKQNIVKGNEQTLCSTFGALFLRNSRITFAEKNVFSSMALLAYYVR